jgi:hypothetical protein
MKKLGCIVLTGLVLFTIYCAIHCPFCAKQCSSEKVLPDLSGMNTQQNPNENAVHVKIHDVAFCADGNPQAVTDNIIPGDVIIQIDSEQELTVSIDETKARDIAICHFGNKYEELADKAEVKFTGNTYVVTIPVPSVDVPAGSRFRGPDFAAQVVVDSKTGEILKVIIGI